MTFGVDKYVVSWNRMCATVYGWRHLVKATEITAGRLPVQRDQLWTQRSVTSMGKLYFLTFYVTINTPILEWFCTLLLTLDIT